MEKPSIILKDFVQIDVSRSPLSIYINSRKITFSKGLIEFFKDPKYVFFSYDEIRGLLAVNVGTEEQKNTLKICKESKSYYIKNKYLIDKLSIIIGVNFNVYSARLEGIETQNDSMVIFDVSKCEINERRKS